MDGRQADPGVLVRRSWAERVDAAVGAGDAQRAAQAVASSRSNLFYDIRPVMTRASGWTRHTSGVYYVEAMFYNELTNRADTSFVFNLWAFRTPPALAQYDIIMAIWRGRWEAFFQTPPAPGTKYTAGNAIDISRYDQQTGAMYIDNAGLTSARRCDPSGGWADSVVVTGALYLDANRFNWSGGAPDGSYGVGLNISWVRVNTPDGEKTVGVFL